MYNIYQLIVTETIEFNKLVEGLYCSFITTSNTFTDVLITFL